MTSHHRAFRSALGAALAIGAVAPGAALARFDQNRVVFHGAATPAGSAVQVIRVTAGGGFDWGDAGIGAAGGLGLSVLGLAGGTAFARGRGRRVA